MSLSEYIREMRKRKDWSQRDLATASGISNAEISRIESGKRKEPSPSVLKAIANALNVPVEEVLQHAGVIERGKAVVDEVLERVGSTHVSELSAASSSDKYSLPRDLTDDELEDIMQYVAFLKSKRK